MFWVLLLKAARYGNDCFNRLNWWLLLAAGFSIVVMTLLTGYEVVVRYIFNRPTVWTLEVSEYLLVAAVYWGMAYTLRVRGHIIVDVVYQRVSPKWQTILSVVGYALILVFCVVLTWQSGAAALKSLRLNEVSPTAMATPMFPIKAIIPLGGFMLCLQALQLMFGSVVTVTEKSSQHHAA